MYADPALLIAAAARVPSGLAQPCSQCHIGQPEAAPTPKWFGVGAFSFSLVAASSGRGMRATRQRVVPPLTPLAPLGARRRRPPEPPERGDLARWQHAALGTAYSGSPSVGTHRNGSPRPS